MGELKGNVGEWSEIYVLLKLISDGILFGADKNIEKINTIYYNVIKIQRHESDDFHQYSRKTKVEISSLNGKFSKFEVDVNSFAEYAEKLKNYLLNKKTPDNDKDIQNFLKTIRCYSLKAKSKDKSDIKITVRDAIMGTEHTLSFSIKSQMSSPSTLFNAGKTTNFVYKLLGENLNKIDIDAFNNFPNFYEKFKYLNDLGIEIIYNKVGDDNFCKNLMLIDYEMPKIMGNMVLKYYSTRGTATNKSSITGTVKNLTQIITSENPCNLDNNFKNIFYEYKMKELLPAIALGMIPGTLWTGKYEANGGYIIVKKTGEILCYQIYDRNVLREYLFENTKLDTPQVSSTKEKDHNFGKIYIKDKNYYINLNLQIRFTK